MKSECFVYRLGTVDYQKAWRLQKRLSGEVAAGERPPALLLLEHPHTFTFGRRGKPDNLLWSEKQLAEKGIRVHWVDRGGDVTYHGPGQLVGYPIIPLFPGNKMSKPDTSGGDSRKLPKADVVGYIRKLEAVLISALAELGVASGQVDGLSGVWVQPHTPSRCLYCPPGMRQKPAKIAMIGLKVDASGISSHGFALNVEPDMSYWEGIIGCGLVGYPVTSLAEIMQPPPEMQVVIETVVQSFAQTYHYRVVEEELRI